MHTNAKEALCKSTHLNIRLLRYSLKWLKKSIVYSLKSPAINASFK